MDYRGQAVIEGRDSTADERDLVVTDEESFRKVESLTQARRERQQYTTEVRMTEDSKRYETFDELFGDLSAIPAKPALSRERVIALWQERIDRAILALTEFQDDLSDWRERTPDDDEFMKSFMMLYGQSLEGWTDQQERPTIDQLRACVTGGEGLEAVKRPETMDEKIEAVFG